jgi:hypothetical protein
MYIIIKGHVAVFKNRDSEEVKAEREFMRIASSIIDKLNIKTDTVPKDQILDFLDEDITLNLMNRLHRVVGGTLLLTQ